MVNDPIHRLDGRELLDSLAARKPQRCDHNRIPACPQVCRQRHPAPEGEPGFRIRERLLENVKNGVGCDSLVAHSSHWRKPVRIGFSQLAQLETSLTTDRILIMSSQNPVDLAECPRHLTHSQIAVTSERSDVPPLTPLGITQGERTQSVFISALTVRGTSRHQHCTWSVK